MVKSYPNRSGSIPHNDATRSLIFFNSSTSAACADTHPRLQKGAAVGEGAILTHLDGILARGGADRERGAGLVSMTFFIALLGSRATAIPQGWNLFPPEPGAIPPGGLGTFLFFEPGATPLEIWETFFFRGATPPGGLGTFFFFRSLLIYSQHRACRLKRVHPNMPSLEKQTLSLSLSQYHVYPMSK